MKQAKVYHPTAFGLAFAAAAGRTKVDHWVARAVEDRIAHTKVGVVAEPAVNAHLTLRTYKALVKQGVME